MFCFVFKFFFFLVYFSDNRKPPQSWTLSSTLTVGNLSAVRHTSEEFPLQIKKLRSRSIQKPLSQLYSTLQVTSRIFMTQHLSLFENTTKIAILHPKFQVAQKCVSMSQPPTAPEFVSTITTDQKLQNRNPNHSALISASSMRTAGSGTAGSTGKLGTISGQRETTTNAILNPPKCTNQQRASSNPEENKRS